MKVCMQCVYWKIIFVEGKVESAEIFQEIGVGICPLITKNANAHNSRIIFWTETAWVISLLWEGNSLECPQLSSWFEQSKYIVFFKSIGYSLLNYMLHLAINFSQNHFGFVGLFLDWAFVICSHYFSHYTQNYNIF